MRIALRIIPFLISLFLLPGCETDFESLGPTPPGEGATIFLHAQFAGPAQAMNADVRDLSRVEGPCSTGAEGERPSWHDCVSSVRVADGWTITLYRDKEFKGRSVTLTADAPNLTELPGPCDGTFNDCVSSLRVSRQ